MKTERVSSLENKGSKRSILLSFTAEDSFSAALSVGQIIKGRVLRHQQAGQYVVAFEGQEKIVESRTPLSVGELIHGRVVGIGEQVEIQRLAVPTPAPSAAEAGATSGTIGQLAAQCNVALKPAELTQLQALAKKWGEPHAVGLSAMVLSKLKLPLHTALIETLFARLKKQAAGMVADLPWFEIEATQNKVKQTDVAEQLGQILQQRLTHAPAIKPQFLEANATDQPTHEALATRLLNTQAGGSITHHLDRIPAEIEAEPIEIEAILFEQMPLKDQPKRAVYKKILFALSTEALGEVEVSLSMTDRLVTCEIMADRAEVMDCFTENKDKLAADLLERNWTLEETRYAVRPSAQTQNKAVAAAMAYIVQQDSVNFLA